MYARGTNPTDPTLQDSGRSQIFNLGLSAAIVVHVTWQRTGGVEQNGVCGRPRGSRRQINVYVTGGINSVVDDRLLRRVRRNSVVNDLPLPTARGMWMFLPAGIVTMGGSWILTITYFIGNYEFLTTAFNPSALVRRTARGFRIALDPESRNYPDARGNRNGNILTEIHTEPALCPTADTACGVTVARPVLSAAPRGGLGVRVTEKHMCCEPTQRLFLSIYPGVYPGGGRFGTIKGEP
ncbi:hypothetical protein EVAR_76489_1 [Eumeta japonica]|uniref:Uncharacterized protein n=1 Tax=Eumeta variegata TaxID=151549 RepID=A0A4C1T5I4_EUMVA|nr:hypothetical protein EVAR_76489_1 [Eumeta japonica]